MLTEIQILVPRLVPAIGCVSEIGNVGRVALVAKTGRLLRQDYNWSTAVAALTMPAMIVVGDADGVRTAHAVEFFELLGGGKADAGWDGSRISNARLCILPGITHDNIFSSPGLAPTVTMFLDGPPSEAR